MFENCINLQDRFNTNTSGPDWKESGNDYAYEAMGELFEAGNSIPHKWWGHETLNLQNFILELIDGTHFVMSHHLAAPFYLSVEELDMYMVDAYDMFGLHAAPPLNESSYKVVKNILKSAHKHLLSGTDKKHIQGVWVDIMKLFKIAGVSKDDIIFRYLIKNCLNKLRQVYGYKIGNYNKMLPVKGSDILKEDNDIVYDHILNYDLYQDFDAVYMEIEFIYNYHRLMLTTSWSKIKNLDYEMVKPIIQMYILDKDLKNVDINDLNKTLEESMKDLVIEINNEVIENK